MTIKKVASKKADVKKTAVKKAPVKKRVVKKTAVRGSSDVRTKRKVAKKRGSAVRSSVKSAGVRNKNCALVLSQKNGKEINYFYYTGAKLGFDSDIRKARWYVSEDAKKEKARLDSEMRSIAGCSIWIFTKK